MKTKNLISTLSSYIPSFQWYLGVNVNGEDEYKVLSFWHPERQAPWIMLVKEYHEKGTVIYADILWLFWPEFQKKKDGLQNEQKSKNDA